VFVTSAGDLSIGIALAVAVAIHNIPEGIAISIPIFYATKSKKKAFLYSFGSGFVEPIGALIAILILMPILNPIILAFLLAFVAGVMVFISFDELLPLTFKEKHNHISVLGVIIGMFVMALSLAFI
ncbi:MAG: ZIP family metal transporter, partial [Nanoarchaeota archaeon]|nr:ZIP family metal transporter [Nanoarchaeota archaeon]